MNFIKKYFIFCAVVSIVGLTIVFAYEPIKTYLQDKKANEEVNNYKKASQNYQEACKELDFEAARTYLYQFRQEYLNCRNKQSEAKYYEAFDYIYKAEIQFLLSEFSDEECVDKITFILTEIPVEGEKAQAGLCRYWSACRDEKEGKPLDAYIVWTEHYNRLCNTILTLAINRNYPKLAKFAIMQFADNVEVYKGSSDGIEIDGVNVDGNHGYIKYTSSDRDAAKKKYKEALQLGAIIE